MQVKQRIEQLIGPEQYPAKRKRLLGHFETLKKVVTGDVFHYQELLFVFGEMVADLG